MPLNKAIETIKDDYCDYIMFIKAKESARSQKRIANTLRLNESNLENITEKECAGVNKKHDKLSNLMRKVLNKVPEETPATNSYKVKDLELLMISLDRLKRDALKIPNFEIISIDEKWDNEEVLNKELTNKNTCKLICKYSKFGYVSFNSNLFSIFKYHSDFIKIFLIVF